MAEKWVFAEIVQENKRLDKKLTRLISTSRKLDIMLKSAIMHATVASLNPSNDRFHFIPTQH